MHAPNQVLYLYTSTYMDTDYYVGTVMARIRFTVNFFGCTFDVKIFIFCQLTVFFVLRKATLLAGAQGEKVTLK